MFIWAGIALRMFIEHGTRFQYTVGEFYAEHVLIFNVVQKKDFM